MIPPKRKAEDVIAELRRAFRRAQEEEAVIFEDTLTGFTIPLIEAGLVDDVEPTPKKRA